MTMIFNASKIALVAAMITVSLSHKADSSKISPSDSVIKKHLILSGAQEVPANDSKAKGTVDLTYDQSTHMLAFSVTYKGLTTAATMAHIHGTAPKGANAGVVVNLTDYLTKATAGHFKDSVMVDGTSIKEDSLMAGLYYINIHTSTHPSGEIRTQLELK